MGPGQLSSAWVTASVGHVVLVFQSVRTESCDKANQKNAFYFK